LWNLTVLPFSLISLRLKRLCGEWFFPALRTNLPCGSALLGLIFSVPYRKVRITKQGGFMSTATMTSKGQITIPAVVRAVLGVEAGDRVEFVQVAPGCFELAPATQSVTALKGLVRMPASPVTITAMNEAIAAQGAKIR